MKPVGQLQFGNFGLLQTCATGVMASSLYLPKRRTSGFTTEQDRLVVRAFEDVRDGASTEALLWDRHLVKRFVQRSKEVGLDYHDVHLCKRIQTIRKSKRHYAAQGIALSPTARKEPQPSIAPTHAHIIEFALVRIRYRFDASIEDILLEPQLGGLFESLCFEVAPELSPQEVRLGALYLRKTRFLENKLRPTVSRLNLSVLDNKWSCLMPLSEIEASAIPEEAGILELCDDSRVLYVNRVKNLQSPLPGLKDESGALSIFSGPIWQPKPSTIGFRYALGKQIDGVSLKTWEIGLIYALRPALNWPIHRKSVA